MAQGIRKFKIFKIVYCLFWIVLSISFPIMESLLVFTTNAVPLWVVGVAAGVGLVVIILFLIYFYKFDKPLRKKFEKAINSHQLLFYAVFFLLIASPGIMFGIVAISVYGFGWAPLPIHVFIICYLILGPFQTLYIIRILKLELSDSE